LIEMKAFGRFIFTKLQLINECLSVFGRASIFSIKLFYSLTSTMLFEIICTLLVTPLLILVYIYMNHLMELNRYPPGPFPLPLIGNLHQVATEPYKVFKEMAKTHGPVFSLSFGSQRLVVVNSIEPAKEALLKKGADFASRPKTYPLQILSRGYKTISMAEYGPFYTTIKKIGHSALKMFADGTGKIEQVTIRESELLHEKLLKTEGRPIDDITYKFGMFHYNTIFK